MFLLFLYDTAHTIFLVLRICIRKRFVHLLLYVFCVILCLKSCNGSLLDGSATNRQAYRKRQDGQLIVEGRCAAKNKWLVGVQIFTCCFGGQFVTSITKENFRMRAFNNDNVY